MTSRLPMWSPTLIKEPNRWRDQDVLVKDGVLALAGALLALIPTLSTIGAQIGDLPQRPTSLLSIGLVLAQTLPLAARRRWPVVCLTVVAAGFAVHQTLGFATTFGSLGLYLALYSAGAHQGRHRYVLAGVMSGGYALMAVVLDRLGSPQGIADYLAFYLALAAIWMVGSTVRGRRLEEAQRRRLAGETATAAERARIARELHDVVTHHVTAMVVQSDAAQFLLTSAPDKAGEGLSAVSDTGRQALTELRYLLGVLEATGDHAAVDPVRDRRAPAPGRLQDLVSQARRSGQPVEFHERGTRRVESVDVELAAYRVVQEALTNALKHAAGSPTQVIVEHGEKYLEVKVTTDEPVRSAGSALAPDVPGVAGGRGLAGLRARVQLTHGQLQAGSRPDGGFEVHAIIPSQPVQE